MNITIHREAFLICGRIYSMRKATLILGLVYILYGLWLLFSVFRLATLYQEFSTTLPPSSLLLPFGVLGYGIVQILTYFLNFKNKKIYTILFILGLIVVVIWISYVLVAGYIANREMEKFLEEYMKSENQF